MKKYLKVSKIAMETFIAYPAEVFAGLIMNTLFVFVAIFVWRALFNNQAVLEGFSLGMILTYAIMTQFLVSAFLKDKPLFDMSSTIISGNFIIYLTKPISFYLHFLFEHIGDMVYSFLIKGLPLIAIFFFLNIFSLPTITQFLLFSASLILAIFLQFTLVFVLALIAFWIEDSFTVASPYYIFAYIFGGRFLPIDFFPGVLRTIIDLMPFRHILYTPIALFVGKITPQEAPKMLLIQGMWIIGLLLIGNFVWKKALRRVTVLGG